MSRQRSFVNPVALLLAALLSYAPAPARGDPLSIAIYDYPPVFIFNNGDSPGYCFEILDRLYSDLGYQVEKREMNLPRAMRSVEEGETDIICSINPFNSKRLKLAPQPNVHIRFQFWARSDSSFRFTGLDSLKGRMMINIVGFNYSPVSPAYQKYLEDNRDQVISISGDQPLRQAFQLLDRGRADAILIDSDNARFNLSQLEMSGRLEAAGGFDAVLKGYPAVGEDHPRGALLLQQFVEGYDRLRASGVVAGIHRKYAHQSPHDRDRDNQPTN